MRLSIGMIVKNEERFLRRCLAALESLRKNVDCELIVVDTGSTDSTVEIAREFTDKVYFFEWCGDFSAARNEALKHAAGEWYMSLDADEIFEDTDELERFLNSKDSEQYVTASIVIENYSDENKSRASSFDAIRLCRHADDLHYEGKIHEQLVSRSLGMEDKIPLCCRLASKIQHYGYIDGIQEKKAERNRELLYSEFEKNKNDAHYYTQLYDLENGCKNFDKSKECAKKCIELAKADNDEVCCSVGYMLYCEAMYLIGEWDELTAAADEYFSLERTFEHICDVPVYMYRGTAKFRNGDYTGAIGDFNEYFRLRKLYDGKSGLEVYTHPINGFIYEDYILRILECAVAYEQTGDYTGLSRHLKNTDISLFDTDYAYRTGYARDFCMHSVLLTAEYGDTSAADRITADGSLHQRELLAGVIREVTEQEREQSEQSAHSEMEMYAQQVKDTVRALISMGNFDDAKILIAQYRELCPDDEETDEIEKMMK